jgi:AsmA protein
MKILKYTAIAVGSLLVLTVLAVVALWMYFDPNDYKGEVQRTVREQTGRELLLPGKISLSLFPDIALEFGPAMLGNAAGFGADPMLQLERVRLGVKLRPLFSKRVEVSSAEIIRPVIRLQVDKGGHDNWSDISEHMKQSPQAPAEKAGSPLNVQIASLKIEDGSLSYTDARTPGTTSLAKLNLTTGELADSRPVKLDLGFVYTQAQSLSADVQLHSTLTADLGNEHYRLDAPLIEVLARGSGFPQEGLPVTLRSPSLDVDLKQQTLDWPGLQADIAGAKLTAGLKGSRIVDEPQLSGTLALAELSPREWLPKFGITPPVTADAAVLKRFALRSAFAGSGKSVQFSNLEADLDDSKLTGSAAITDLDSMAMQFDLQVNRLNADRYLAPAPPAAKPAAGAKPASPPVAIPVDMLRALNMRGSLRVAQAVFAGVQFSGLRVGVDAARGRVHLAPLEAGLYGGQYKGDISLDASGLPRVSFNDQITGVDFAPLARDWLETNKVSGRGNLSVKADASGKDSDAMLRTLNGSLALKVDNGALEGKDILYEIRRARALLKKEPLPERTGPERTAFSQLAATGTIADGVVTSNDLLAATQVMRVNGKGSVNLVASQIDYRLDVAVLKAAEGRTLPPDLADTAGLVVPVRVTGSLGDPSIRPDLEAMVKAAVQQKVDEKKKELEDKLRDQLGDKLKGLLGH